MFKLIFFKVSFFKSNSFRLIFFKLTFCKLTSNSILKSYSSKFGSKSVFCEAASHGDGISGVSSANGLEGRWSQSDILSCSLWWLHAGSYQNLVLRHLCFDLNFFKLKCFKLNVYAYIF